METLKGKNIIERMNQLMNYGQSKTPTQEGRNWANLEYSIKAPDGKTYGILRDQTKFYIKESTTDNPTVKDFEFIGGTINGSKKYYTNYSHALNYLNLMIAEMNQKNPKAKAINLLEECYKPVPMDEAKKEKEVDEKTVLKVPKEQPAPAMPTAPEQPKGDNTNLDLGGDTNLDFGDDNLDDDSGNEDADLGGDLGLDDDEGPIEGGDTIKQIQKLTGKLGQSVRELDEPNPDLTKYVMNSVLSALDLQDLDDSDQKQILKKIKKKMAGEGEFADNDSTDIGDDEDSLDFDFGDSEGSEDTGADQGALNLPKKQKPGELDEISTGLANRASELGWKKSYKASNDMDPILNKKYAQQAKRISQYTNPTIEKEIQKFGGKITDKNENNMVVNIGNLTLKISPSNYEVKEGNLQDTDPKLIQVLPRLIKTIQSDMMLGGQGEMRESDAPYGEKKEPQNVKGKSAPFHEKPTKLKTESKVKKTITKYFELSPAEKAEETTKFLNESINKVILLKEGKAKCKTVEQAMALTKVLDYDNHFTIKTMNENIVLDPSRKINLGGKEYKKLIMVENNGRVSGILKEVVTKNAHQYRMKDKNDYLNFIKLGQ